MQWISLLHLRSQQDLNLKLKTVLQFYREHGQATHVLFVDLVKAFDTVNHEFLWLVLKKYGLPYLYWNLMLRGKA